MKIAKDLEEARPGYGTLFLAAAEDVLRRIAALPNAFPLVQQREDVHRGVWAGSFGKFAVYFKSDSNGCTVLAVLHAARRPGAWGR